MQELVKEVNNFGDIWWDKDSREYGKQLFKILKIDGNICCDLRILKLFKNRRTFFKAIKEAFLFRNLEEFKEELLSNWNLTHIYFVTLSLAESKKERLPRTKRVDLIIATINKWREDNPDYGEQCNLEMIDQLLSI